MSSVFISLECSGKIGSAFSQGNDCGEMKDGPMMSGHFDEEHVASINISASLEEVNIPALQVAKIPEYRRQTRPLSSGAIKSVHSLVVDMAIFTSAEFDDFPSYKK